MVLRRRVVKSKAYFIWVLPLRILLADVREVIWYTRSLFS